MNQNTRAWLHGLFAAIIGGSAAAVGGVISVTMIDSSAFNFGNQMVHMLELIGSSALTGGLVAAVAFLKQSPLPAEVMTVTETKSSTVEVTKDSK